MISETAERILGCVRRYPGIHLRGIERALGLSSPLVHYHLKELVARGLVVGERLHGYVRYFPADLPAPSPDDRALLALLREDTPTALVLLLLDEGPLSHTDLARRAGLAKSTVTYQVDKLLEAGVLARDAAAVRVADETRVRRLLRAHRPTPDLLARFRALWESFYG